MNIEDGKVVQFSYKLFDESGELLEATDTGNPTAYLHGKNNMMPGLEKALSGKTTGEQVKVTLAPAEAYGERREGSEQRIPVKHLQGAKKWKPGMIANVNTDQGMRQVRVVKVGKFMVTVDNNHPLAGKTLSFEIDILDVRDATAEELSHGHAHGVGGHHH